MEPGAAAAKGGAATGHAERRRRKRNKKRSACGDKSVSVWELVQEDLVQVKESVAQGDRLIPKKCRPRSLRHRVSDRISPSCKTENQSVALVLTPNHLD